LRILDTKDIFKEKNIFKEKTVDLIPVLLINIILAQEQNQNSTGTLAMVESAVGSSNSRSATGSTPAPVPAPVPPPPPPPMPPPPPSWCGPSPSRTARIPKVHVEIQNTDNTAMEQETEINLGHVYKQCKVARRSAHLAQVTRITRTEGGVLYNTDTVAAPVLGSFDEEDTDILRTFHGSRGHKGSEQVNQSVSSSFDPQNLSCVMCSEEHCILDQSKTTVVCFTDQNFPSTLSGNKDNCLAVMRMEDASLAELADLVIEVLTGSKIPTGTVLLIGSGSHLFRVGASAYAYDWIEMLSIVGSRFKGIRIIPAIPVVPGGCPGGLSRDIGQLAVWISQVYKNDACGIHDAWAALIRNTDVRMQGGSPLETHESIKLSMPKGLGDQKPMPYIFSYNSSGPAQLTGMDSKATVELVRVLLVTLVRDFSLNACPEIILGKAEQMGVGTKHNSSIAVVGASIMAQMIPHLSALGLTVIDLTRPGWVPSPEGLAEVTERLRDIPKVGTIFRS